MEFLYLIEVLVQQDSVRIQVRSLKEKKWLVSGDVHKTLQNLQVVKVDEAKNIICVKGATPGARGTWLVVEDSIKRNDIKEVENTAVQAEKSTKKDK